MFRSSRCRAVAPAGAALAVAGTLVAASPGAAATPPAPVAATALCTIPLIGVEPLQTSITALLRTPVGGTLAPFSVTLNGSLGDSTQMGFGLVGAVSFSGTARLASDYTLTDGSVLSLSIPMTLSTGAIDVASSAPLPFTATGSSPSTVITSSAPLQSWAPTGLLFSMRIVDGTGATVQLGDPADSDKNPDTFDLPCANWENVYDLATPTPTPTPTPSPAPTPTHVDPPTPAPPTPTPPATPAPTSPTPTLPPPTFFPPTNPPGTPTPVADPVDPTPSPTPTPVVTPAHTPTPTPTLIGDPFFVYRITGQAYLKTMTTGTVPMTGSFRPTFNFATGSLTASTALNDTTAKLKALNALPVTATLGFAEVGPTTGSLNAGTLTMSTAQLMRIKSAKLFGISLVTKTCVTSKPSTVPLRSASDGFSPSRGGTLTGSFAIAPLVNCGFLGSIVSGLTAGSGNAISLTLTP